MDLPQKDKVAQCLDQLLFLLFPEHLRPRHFLKEVRAELIEQARRAFEYTKRPSVAESAVDDFLGTLSTIKKRLLLDAQAACDRDPAAEGLDEVILSYPGFLALATYRLAHELANRKVPFIPRMMSETAHSLTGCDIHPNAEIGESFFIDHATGVVIGQTSVIGDRVTIFQGVTLGATALQEKGSTAKRHPTIEDDVVIYSNATILGGKTVIGKRSVIGGSCWITFSVPPDSKVILANPRSLLTQSQNNVESIPNWDI